MTKALRMFLLQYGAERVSKSLSLEGGSQHLYWEPLLGIAVETTDGWVLIDTGMSRAAHLSPENQKAYIAGGVEAPNIDAEWRLSPVPPQPDEWNWILAGDPLCSALEAIGLAPKDISLAAISHAHVDHSGGIPTLSRAGVPIAIQKAELDFIRSGKVGIAEGFHKPDWTSPETKWVELDGDTQIAPGVKAIFTPGHTPGHMSFLIELEQSGSWLFCTDAVDLAQNLLDNTPCGSFAGGTQQDRANAHASLERLLEIASECNARIIPGHDQIIANAIKHPIGGHR